MIVNSVNGINSANQYSKTPSFKSVIPVKVFTDGVISSSKKNNEKAFKEFYRILRKPKTESENSIRTIFLKQVPDYKIHTKPDKSFITSSTIDGKFYIFTGNEAEKLAKYSDEIGYAQHEGLENCETSDTYEARVAKQEYYRKVAELISSSAVLKKLEETATGFAYGDKLGLHINSKGQGLPGEKGHKLEIVDVIFRRIKESVSQAAKAVDEATSGKNNLENGEQIPEGSWTEYFFSNLRKNC